jgi:hypothetical protein
MTDDPTANGKKTKYGWGMVVNANFNQISVVLK